MGGVYGGLWGRVPPRSLIAAVKVVGDRHRRAHGSLRGRLLPPHHGLGWVWAGQCGVRYACRVCGDEQSRDRPHPRPRPGENELVRLSRDNLDERRIASSTNVPQASGLASPGCSRCLIAPVPLPRPTPNSCRRLWPRRPACVPFRCATLSGAAAMS